MSPRLRWLILGLALVGLAFASSSAWVHYKLVTDPTYVSPCDINATFNCSQVYLSSYGAIGGVPVAIGGMIWFGLVALIAGFAKPGEPRSAAGGYLFALSTIGLASVLYLGYASFVTLRTGCLLCIGTYVSVIGIFLATGLSKSVSLGGLPGRLMKDLRAVFATPATLLAGVLFVAAAASAVAFFPREAGAPRASAAPAPGANDTETFTNAWNAQPRANLGVPAEGAKVLVVKFVDWQCPSCKAAHYSYKPILDRFAQSHPGQVREVIKDYPLSNKCNPFMSQPAHVSACESAAAVRMARARGKADQMVNFMFTVPGQQEVRPEQIRAEIARIIGEPTFNFDQEYAAEVEKIKQDVADAGALRVGSTPTYFINGVHARGANGGWLPPQYFELAVKIELAKGGGQ